MSIKKIIYCSFLKRKSESLDFQCYPGKLGKKIFENISKEAWRKWEQKQIILINEKKLNMANVNHRNFLEKEMVYFLFKEEEPIL